MQKSGHTEAIRRARLLCRAQEYYYWTHRALKHAF